MSLIAPTVAHTNANSKNTGRSFEFPDIKPKDKATDNIIKAKEAITISSKT